MISMKWPERCRRVGKKDFDGMMARDRIHNSAKGYSVQGELLYEALRKHFRLSRAYKKSLQINLLHENNVTA